MTKSMKGTKFRPSVSWRIVYTACAVVSLLVLGLLGLAANAIASEIQQAQSAYDLEVEQIEVLGKEQRGALAKHAFAAQDGQSTLEGIESLLELADTTLGAEQKASLLVQVEYLRTVLGLPAIEQVDLPVIPAESPNGSDELTAETQRLIESISTSAEYIESVQRRTQMLNTGITLVERETAAYAESGIVAAESAIENNDKASDSSKTRLADSADALALQFNSETITEYIESLKAVVASHKAVVQKEKEAAARQGNGPRGPYVPNPGGPNPGPGPGPGPNPDPKPPVYDQNRYISTNAHYVPYSSCNGAKYGTHDPGGGGTSKPSFSVPWSYTVIGSPGAWFQFYVCM